MGVVRFFQEVAGLAILPIGTLPLIETLRTGAVIQSEQRASKILSVIGVS